MVDYSRTKESKRFKDRISSLVPQVFVPPGTFKPTPQQVQEGKENFLNPLFMKALINWHAAKKIQPSVEKYDNFEQPGYSPDYEVFWNERMKAELRQLRKEIQDAHNREKRK